MLNRQYLHMYKPKQLYVMQDLFCFVFNVNGLFE